MSVNIPSLDLSHFLSNDNYVKNKFVTDLGSAYEQIGFIALKGHFLSKVYFVQIYRQI